MTEQIRKFETGATRDAALDPATGLPKLAYHGFFSPTVMKRRAEYMNKHRIQPDGNLRAPDNWKKGIPQDVYLDSLIRHVMDLWLCVEGVDGIDKVETICAIGFNADGLLHELLKEKTGGEALASHRYLLLGETIHTGDEATHDGDTWVKVSPEAVGMDFGPRNVPIRRPLP